ncbi:flagellar biosynthesis anti-sigma factor FlgM [Paenalcaligenes faecalis]|uniref:flagellar biosynthesis anti-sigma factor FlgM n=1 Tax=Paenalcaligenes faecalis TaxID=2980099 RepID=UPI0022B9C058|nr:flagellar biosynthesis anti-sigma factor FlgM [Paenalcaligenes faecalis]
MKITNNNYRHNIPERINQKNTAVNAYQETNSASRSAAVDLSPAARQLQQLQSSTNDIDMGRVQALRDAIANGTLEMDTSRIADSIINSARDLLK